MGANWISDSVGDIVFTMGLRYDVWRIDHYHLLGMRCRAALRFAAWPCWRSTIVVNETDWSSQFEWQWPRSSDCLLYLRLLRMMSAVQSDVSKGVHAASLPTEMQVASLTVARHLGAVRMQRHQTQVDDLIKWLRSWSKKFQLDSGWFAETLIIANDQALDYIVRDAAMDAVEFCHLLSWWKAHAANFEGAARAPSDSILVVDWGVLLLGFRANSALYAWYIMIMSYLTAVLLYIGKSQEEKGLDCRKVSSRQTWLIKYDCLVRVSDFLEMQPCSYESVPVTLKCYWSASRWTTACRHVQW